MPFSHLSSCQHLALTACRSYERIYFTDSDSVPIRSGYTGRGLDHNVPFSGFTTALSHFASLHAAPASDPKITLNIVISVQHAAEDLNSLYRMEAFQRPRPSAPA